jgi:hypothetical protein
MTQRCWPVVSLVLALALGAVVLAQPSTPMPPPDPSVLTGSDIGFRVVYFDGRKPVGTLVVRVNGQWVEPKTPPSMMLLQPK